MTSQLEALELSIVDTERAGEEYAKAALLEGVLQHSRHGARQEAVRRLMEPRIDPKRALDGEFKKLPALAGSVSAAEKMVESDPTYAAHLESEREATFQKNLAYAKRTAAILRSIGKVVAILESDPNLVKGLLAFLITPDLVRSADEERSQLVGGVPR